MPNSERCPKCEKPLLPGAYLIETGSTIITSYGLDDICSCNQGAITNRQIQDFEIFLKCLGVAYREFCLNKQIHEKIGAGTYIKFRKQWDVTLVALEMDYKLWLAKILDKNDAPACLKGLVAERGPIIVVFEKWRNNFLAHFNERTLRSFEKFRGQYEIDEDSVQILFDKLIEIADKYNKNYRALLDVKESFKQIKQESLDGCDKWLDNFKEV